MNDIDKYMIPLDSIRSADAWDITGMIFLALLIGMLAALIVAVILDWSIDRSDPATRIAAPVTAIITTVIACYLMFGAGLAKSIDTSKIDDEYGIIVTSMKSTDDHDNAVETHSVSYLHDGTLVNGTLIVKDGAAGLFAGKGDKLTPVKPRSIDDASASSTTSKTTDSHANASKPSKSARSRAGCYAKSYNKDGSIRELAGDCPATATH